MNYPIGKHEENEKLKREIDELKAMVNALRVAGSAVVARWDSPNWLDGTHTLDYITRLRSVIAKTPARSLHDHDMAIAEAVREACSNAVWHGDYDEVKRIIRNVDLVPIVSEVN